MKRRRGISTEPPRQDGAYAMRIAARLTGIDPDTLRAWERRYGFPRPARTAGGMRLYSAEEVAKLRLVARALRHGFRPSDVVSRSVAELEQVVASVTTPDRGDAAAAPDYAEVMTELLGRGEVDELRAALRRAAVVLGPSRFVIEVAHPLALRVGDLWAKGALEVHQEHLMTELLRTQLRLLQTTVVDDALGPIVLLATLPDEPHGLGLDMVALYLASAGAVPRVLGVNTPRDQVVLAARVHGASVVGLSVLPSSDVTAAARDLRWMADELPRRVAVWVGGAGAAQVPLAGLPVRLVDSWAAMDAAAAQLLDAAPSKRR